MEQKNRLNNYLKLIFPEALEETEFLRILKSQENFTTNIFCKTNQVEKIIKQNRNEYNLFIALATCNGENGQESGAKTRSVLFFDIDKKDNPDITEQDVTEYFKKYFPYIFIHCIIDSGNGFHLYIAIQPTTDIKKIVSLTTTMINILNRGEKFKFDTNANLPTQIARIPTSQNRKNDKNPLWVNVIVNNVNSDKFKRYSLDEIENQINKVNNKITYCPCIENMLEKGAIKGERNYCLGFIISYLRFEKYLSKDKILSIVNKYNANCSPPKSNNELSQQFNTYWEKGYEHFFNCKPINQENKNILKKYCEQKKCKIKNKQNTEYRFALHSALCDKKYLRNLSNLEYLILLILNNQPKSYSNKEIQKKLSDMGKSITLKNINISFLNLKKLKLIKIDKDERVSCKNGYFKASNIFINKNYIISLIKENSLCCVKLLVALIYCITKQHDSSYDELSYLTHINKGNISRYIKRIMQANIIEITKELNDNNVMLNRYKLL